MEPPPNPKEVNNFPLMKLLNIPDEVFDFNRKFKPKGSALRMQEIIETIKLLAEDDDDEDDEIDFSVDDLATSRSIRCWSGISTSPSKRKAESIIQNKNPTKTFWECDKGEQIELEQLKFAEIKAEKDGKILFAHDTRENNNTSFSEESESDRSWDNSNNANDTTIDMNYGISAHESDSSVKSVNSPAPSPKVDPCLNAKPVTSRISSRKKEQDCFTAPRLYFGKTSAVTVVVEKATPFLPPANFGSQTQSKRMHSKFNSGSILKPREYFKGGKSDLSAIPTTSKPRSHFKSNSGLTMQKMIPIKKRTD
ncbi:hypothetical protein Ocin01_03981 [Orchesella cincta]|uniref:Uncharacterized protein n=1 Tax=Orchesella cincta TaxID=48709 RepID=A0A1D2NBS4_ORCCI|nr:hypothetical protein Ocin01_03981 [Orchesella cincta]